MNYSSDASPHAAFRRFLGWQMPTVEIAEHRTEQLNRLDEEEREALAIQRSPHYVTTHDGSLVEGPMVTFSSITHPRFEPGSGC